VLAWEDKDGGIGFVCRLVEADLGSAAATAMANADCRVTRDGLPI